MAGGTESAVGDTYTWATASVYVFNLIVGVGALTLPMAFYEAGLILATIFMVVLAYLGMITASWMVEAQAAANRVLDATSEVEDEFGEPLIESTLQRETRESLVSWKDELENEAGAEQEELFTYVDDDGADDMSDLEEEVVGHVTSKFHLENKVEMGQMAETFLGWKGKLLFYLFLVVYLYGDLAIYAALVPKAITTVTGPDSLNLGSPWDSNYFWLVIFCAGTIPFCFFNFQKTKYLQLITMALRNIAFIVMISVAALTVAKGQGVSFSQIPWFNVAGLTTLFGKTVRLVLSVRSLTFLGVLFHVPPFNSWFRDAH